MDERDRQKTGFVTPDGLYEFRVMLCTAPETLQRVMDTVLADLKRQTCLVVIFSRTFDDDLRRLGAVLKALETTDLRLNPKKCRFAYHELRFLGHVISNENVSPGRAKTVAVRASPTPTDKSAVRRFLGFCALYRRFIPNFSQIAATLTYLTKEQVSFQ